MAIFSKTYFLKFFNLKNKNIFLYLLKINVFDTWFLKKTKNLNIVVFINNFSNVIL